AAREALPLPGVSGLRRDGPRAAPAIISEFSRPVQFLELIRQSFPEAGIGPFDRALVAYRTGSEKLHWASDGRHRLYDLARDPGETTDLSAERPERTAELAAEVESWLRRPGSRPPVGLAPGASRRSDGPIPGRGRGGARSRAGAHLSRGRIHRAGGPVGRGRRSHAAS